MSPRDSSKDTELLSGAVMSQPGSSPPTNDLVGISQRQRDKLNSVSQPWLLVKEGHHEPRLQPSPPTSGIGAPTNGLLPSVPPSLLAGRTGYGTETAALTQTHSTPIRATLLLESAGDRPQNLLGGNPCLKTISWPAWL